MLPYSDDFEREREEETGVDDKSNDINYIKLLCRRILRQNCRNMLRKTELHSLTYFQTYSNKKHHTAT